MPRYEIVAHLTRELDGETAEEAAAAFRGQLLSLEAPADRLVNLAVWRQGSRDASPLPPAPRQLLIDFFAAVQSCAVAAEEEFRGRVEALLMAEPPERAEARQGSAENDAS